MRLGFLFWLPFAFFACYAETPKEDVRAIQRVLAKHDSSLDWVRVLAKKPVDAIHSVMLVEAAPTELRPGQMRIGVFVVSGADNQVRLTLDSYPLREVVATPTLDEPTEHAAYLHFYSDYGMYQGSTKYIYDLASGNPVKKIPYGILALTSSTRENGKLQYQASFGSERHAILTIAPSAGGLPGFQIVHSAAPQYAYEQPTSLRATNGESVTVANKTPPGQPHQPSGIYVAGKSGTKQLFPAPRPTMEFYRKMLPGKQPPLEIGSDIGPFVLSGARVWFTSTFYDGEGDSGLGAIGTFDIPSRKYQMRYLPEIVEWSGSTILLDGDDLWIGLIRRPEGATYGGGLLRYNTKVGSVRNYAVPDVVNTIDRLGDALYCGTSHGVYMLRDDKLTQLRFEPDGKGKLSMVARDVR